MLLAAIANHYLRANARRLFAAAVVIAASRCSQADARHLFAAAVVALALAIAVGRRRRRLIKRLAFRFGLLPTRVPVCPSGMSPRLALSPAFRHYLSPTIWQQNHHAPPLMNAAATGRCSQAISRRLFVTAVAAALAIAITVGRRRRRLIKRLAFRFGILPTRIPVRPSGMPLRLALSPTLSPAFRHYLSPAIRQKNHNAPHLCRYHRPLFASGYARLTCRRCRPCRCDSRREARAAAHRTARPSL